MFILNKFFGDYHTHTTMSDGKNSVSDLVRYAEKNGFSELAITDHGYGNVACAMTDDKLKILRREADKHNAQNTDLKILIGVEADFVSYDGSIDLTEDRFQAFDVVTVGFHRFVKTKKFSEWFGLEFYNGFLAKRFGASEKRRRKNTDMVVSALERYDVDILAHINHYLKVDAKRVGEVCAKRGTYVEMNQKHLDVLEEVIDELLETDCLFIANSDNHDVKKCDNLDKVAEFVERHNIPESRVVNLGKTPTFKNHGGQNGKS